MSGGLGGLLRLCRGSYRALAAASFGREQRGVGALEKVLGRFDPAKVRIGPKPRGIPRRHSESDGAAAWQWHRLLARLDDQALGETARLRLPAAGQNDTELVTSEPTGQVPAAQELPYQPPRLRQHEVAGSVAVGIVDGLEAVDIEDD